MYTEEQEFDYNEYLNESENNNGKNSLNKGLIAKIILIILVIILVIFLVFKVQNRGSNNNNNNNNQNSESYLLVFNNNIETLRAAAYEYFFTNGNIPELEGDVINININDLREQGLVTEITDYDGSVCGYNTSYISLTRNKNDYLLEIHLLCPSIENTVSYYYDLEYNCLNCNGEDYIPSDDDSNDDVLDNEETTDDNNQTDEETNDDDNQTELVCQEFGDWTTQYLADSNLDRESRVVVIGYKENISYGEWSTPSTIAITPSDTLEVKTEVRTETKTETSDWSQESTTKPASKDGREISSRNVTSTYTTQSCTGGTTYTKQTTFWDDNATRCVATAIGKYTCTYKTEKVCKDVKKTRTTTYYKYRDTTTYTQDVTYYSSREIKKNLVYTDYILESEMPSGYQKLAGSEVTQYRYREKCNLK